MTPANPAERTLHLMQCLACHTFGVPISPTDTVCGNCGNSTDTHMWFRPLVAAQPPSVVVAREEEDAGAVADVGTQVGAALPSIGDREPSAGAQGVDSSTTSAFCRTQREGA